LLEYLPASAVQILREAAAEKGAGAGRLSAETAEARRLCTSTQRKSSGASSKPRWRKRNWSLSVICIPTKTPPTPLGCVSVKQGGTQALPWSSLHFLDWTWAAGTLQSQKGHF